MKKNHLLFIAFMVLSVSVIQSCKKDDDPDPGSNNDPGVSGNQLTDSRDNKTYQIVTIGSQTWMAENLNFQSPTTGSVYCYEDKSDSCTKYGALYTWEAAKVACPSGWRLPSDKDWQNLEFQLGMPASDTSVTGSYRGTDQGTKLKVGGSSGFNGKLSGLRYSNGSFSDVTNATAFWTSTADAMASSNAYDRVLSKTNAGILRTTYDKSAAFCVRCIKN